jgi:hypothetical protein
MDSIILSDEYLDKYNFVMYTKAGENACRSIVRAAWKKLGSTTRVTSQEMYEYLTARMDVVKAKHPEVWDTEPRYHIFLLVAKKAKEYEYDFSNNLGN